MSDYLVLNLLLALGAAVLAFAAEARARDIARQTMTSWCDRRALQFLDQSVALVGWGVARTRSGFAIERRFRFEVSSDQLTRWPGTLSLRGSKAVLLTLDDPSGPIIEPLQGH